MSIILYEACFILELVLVFLLLLCYYPYKGGIAMPIPIIIIILLFLIIGFIIAIYNGLVGLRNQVQSAWSQIDVELQRRFDLIPNFVETVKTFMFLLCTMRKRRGVPRRCF